MWMALSSSNDKRKANDKPTKVRLTDIPDALMEQVASYLPHKSCIYFAKAIQKSQSTSFLLPSETSLAIATVSQTIDFKDVEYICGRRLTDRDVRLILIMIDGVNKIKSLKLTHCFLLKGTGLLPLCGSTILERIDLSLVGDNENPNIHPEPQISISAVIPILKSIITKKRNSLVHVQLPKKWRTKKSPSVSRFLFRFDIELNRRNIKCSNPDCMGDGLCTSNEICPLVEGQRSRFLDGTCYQCMKHFCFFCTINCKVAFCQTCDKFYCDDCNKVVPCFQGYCENEPASCRACNTIRCCASCGDGICSDCKQPWSSCQYCDERYCRDCSWDDMNICDGCDRGNCHGDCTSKHLDRAECVTASQCKSGEPHKFCFDCRLLECKEHRVREPWCIGCVGITAFLQVYAYRYSCLASIMVATFYIVPSFRLHLGNYGTSCLVFLLVLGCAITLLAMYHYLQKKCFGLDTEQP